MAYRLGVWMSSAVLLAALGACPAAELPEGFSYELAPEQCDGEYSIACTVAAGGRWRRDVEARIVFDCNDEGSFHTLTINEDGLTLARLRSDRFIRMARDEKLNLPEQFQLVVHRRDDRIDVLIDGRKVFSENAVIDMAGRIGQGVSGGATVSDLILQPVSDLRFSDDFTRVGDEMATWEMLEGDWENTALASEGFLETFSANAFSLRAEGRPRALARSGEWFWDAYNAAVSVRPTTAAVVGICAHVRDPSNLLVFRWTKGDDATPDARQLVLAQDGKYEVLASAPGGFRPEQWYRLGIRVSGNEATAYVDGFPCLDVSTDALTNGPVGILASEGEAFFDDMTLAPADEAAVPLVALPEQFVNDPIMQKMGVSTARSAWTGPVGGAFWHIGAFFDDVHIELPIDTIGANPAAVCLRAAGRTTASGYQVVLLWSTDYLSFDVLKAGTSIQRFGAPCPADGLVEVDLAGDTISFFVDGERIHSYTDPEPLFAGGDLGLIVPSQQALSQTVVTSTHQRDCTFTTAPTEWIVTKGNWGTDVRWPCDRRWAFFGGKDDENPCIWSKESYTGDVVVEAYGAIRMDIPYCPGYTHPSDLCLTLCGNGRDLNSGYSFIFAGFNNTRSCIMKGDQVVVEKPGLVFEQPVNTNLAFQRAWFRLRAEKMGSTVRFFVNGQLVGQFDDPEPLAGGQAAVWSYRNGPIVARVRTWFRDAQPAPLPPVFQPLPQRPEAYRWAEGTFTDFEKDLGEWHTIAGGGARVVADSENAATGNRSLAVVNAVSGGPFAAYATVEPFSVADWPLMTFDYAIPADVKINLYIYARGAWHTVLMTGGPPADASVKLLGQLPGVVADGQWHSAGFDLRVALLPLYPDGRVRVSCLALASPANANDYLRCGIGGNPLGAVYRIDNFRLGTAQE